MDWDSCDSSNPDWRRDGEAGEPEGRRARQGRRKSFYPTQGASAKEEDKRTGGGSNDDTKGPGKLCFWERSYQSSAGVNLRWHTSYKTGVYFVGSVGKENHRDTFHRNIL